MKNPSPFTAARVGLAILIIFVGLFSHNSCSEQSSKILLRINYGPQGKILKYTLDINRAGKSFKNNEFQGDFERKLNAEVAYSTQKVYPDGSFGVLEKNTWNWDEILDSNKVNRKTIEYTYDLRVSPTGEILSFDMVGDVSLSYKKYAASYYKQGIMILPDSAVAPGFSWTQTSLVESVKGDSTEVSTTYTVKGRSRKMGYDCTVIEFRGNLVLPFFRDPEDTLGTWGVDHAENSGILYFANEEGFAVSSEERARVRHERHFLEKGKEVTKISEFDEAASYKLAEVTGL